MTVYWMVWDAAAAWLVDRLDAEGALPAVRRLRAAGVRGRARPASPNCQTPAALATLFTGTDTAVHGVSGFDVPGGPGDPVEQVRAGFAPDLLARPPVWQAAHERGLRTAFVHVPWVFPAEGPPEQQVVAAVEAYSHRLTGAGLQQLPPPGREHTWRAGPYQLRLRAGAAGAHLWMHGGTDDQPVALDAASGWVPVAYGPASGLWVRYLTGPEGPIVVHTGGWLRRVAGAHRPSAQRLAGGRVFAGEGLKALYRTGALGDRLVDGGDGTAEEIFVSSLDCVARSFADALDAVLPGPDGGGAAADLVVIYLPWTDDAGHEMAGWCDPRSSAHRPDVAAAVWAQVRRCYTWNDALLGRVLDRAGPGDTVMLCADHGIVGSAYLVAVNQALLAAGLAAAHPGGELDPRSSKVIYHPANNGELRVNHDGFAGGLVPRHHSGALLREATSVLAALPATPGGRPVVRGFLDSRGRVVEPATIAPDQDSLFVMLHDDYQPTAAVDGHPVLRPMDKSGAHVVNTGDDRLQATFAAAGPGLSPGEDLGVIDNTFAAALVRHQLTLPDCPAAGTPDTGIASLTAGTRPRQRPVRTASP